MGADGGLLVGGSAARHLRDQVGEAESIFAVAPHETCRRLQNLISASHLLPHCAPQAIARLNTGDDIRNVDHFTPRDL